MRGRGGGMAAGGGEAHGLVSASASGHTGGRIGGHTGADTGDPMPTATPMAMRTRRWSPPHRPRSISNPHPRRPFGLLHQPPGITVTAHGGITPTCSNVQGDGEQSPLRRHKPEAGSCRAIVRGNEGSPQQAAGYQPPKPVTLKTAPSGRLNDGASYTSFRCLAA
jgi:hypothetical protein